MDFRGLDLGVFRTVESLVFFRIQDATAFLRVWIFKVSWMFGFLRSFGCLDFGVFQGFGSFSFADTKM